ncbi:MAG TPA: ABC transporter permease subunit [Candidatus Limnocylindrales bacterium]|nr:ABC transporter permease subunit [Candidatus Limnocylindrales bacterium]
MSTAVGTLQRGFAAPSRTAIGIALVAVVAGLFVVFVGQDTIPHDDDAATFHRFNEARDWLDLNRLTNPVLVGLTALRTVFTALYELMLAALQAVTWPGLTAVGAALGLAAGGWRLALLLAGGFLSFGLLGLWDRSIETIALTAAAVVVALAIGIPLGVLAGRSPRVLRAAQPILDFMQIMPTFAYLAPLTLIFLIGPATAAIVTMIYAIAPAIRITALGVGGVSPATVEAATSLGSTKRQLLTKVQLPMARKTIILGINQTIMMALSMVVITALVDAPGLGKNIIHALQQNDVGLAFDAGLAIVIMAVMFDRLTTAASERTEPGRSGTSAARRFLATRAGRAALIGVPAAVVVAGVAIAATTFPDAPRLSFREPLNAAVDWISLNAFAVTDSIKNAVTFALINPIEGFLTKSPWWLIVALVVGLAVLVSGRRQAILAALCLGAILAIQMWEHSMATLAQVIVAIVLTLGIGLVVGIASARSNRFSRTLRPVLDGAQTMPAFVYLLPAVALFGPTRFTAIVAALIYAVPPVIRLVEVGLRTVPSTPREAAISAGATRRQLLYKVELPLARPALLVAANQGIIMVLAMVVVGGLVGGGALGYDVVAGFARRAFFGEGLAAALAIVLLGIALDRITQGAGSQRRRALVDRAGGPGPGIARFRGA